MCLMESENRGKIDTNHEVFGHVFFLVDADEMCVVEGVSERWQVCICRVDKKTALFGWLYCINCCHIHV